MHCIEFCGLYKSSRANVSLRRMSDDPGSNLQAAFLTVTSCTRLCPPANNLPYGASSQASALQRLVWVWKGT